MLLNWESIWHKIYFIVLTKGIAHFFIQHLLSQIGLQMKQKYKWWGKNMVVQSSWIAERHKVVWLFSSSCAATKYHIHDITTIYPGYIGHCSHHNEMPGPMQNVHFLHSLPPFALHMAFLHSHSHKHLEPWGNIGNSQGEQRGQSGKSFLHRVLHCTC